MELSGVNIIRELISFLGSALKNIQHQLPIPEPVSPEINDIVPVWPDTPEGFIPPSELLGSTHTLLFYLLIVSIGIVLFVRQQNGKYFQTIYDSATNFNLSNQLFREQEFRGIGMPILLLLNSVLCLGMALFLSLKNFSSLGSAPTTILLIGSILFLVLCFAFRYSTHKLLNWILPVKQYVDVYLYNVFITYTMLGMICLPLVIIAAFSQVILVKVALGLVGVCVLLAVLYRIYRGMKIGRDTILANKFHFFLYLCTLEIIPLLFLVKVLNDYII